MRVANKLTPEPKSKMAETCLSIPDESKRAKICLSPPMWVAKKLTLEPKSKMAKNTPEHPGREQNS